MMGDERGRTVMTFWMGMYLATFSLGQAGQHWARQLIRSVRGQRGSRLQVLR